MAIELTNPWKAAEGTCDVNCKMEVQKLLASAATMRLVRARMVCLFSTRCFSRPADRGVRPVESGRGYLALPALPVNP